MTAFITHCWKNSPSLEACFKRWRARLMRALALIVVLGACWGAGLAQAETAVELEALKFERQDAALAMSADVRFELPATLEDALRKGITLYFVTEVEITQERWYFYNQRVARAERHVRLFYQPLTRRWRVNVSPQPFSAGGLGMSLAQSYDSVEDALVAVRRIVQWRVANASDYNPEAKQTVTLNFKLDLKQLPRPLQIGAAGQSDWNISLTKTQRLELAP